MDAGPPSEGTPLALDEVRDDVARLRGEMARDVCKISADLLKAVGGTLLRGLLAVLIVIGSLLPFLLTGKGGSLSLSGKR